MTTDFSGSIGPAEVALALGLVVVALAVSRLRHAALERDIAVATLRSFAQLLAIGWILAYAFAEGRGWLTPVILTVMIATATATSASRGRRVPGARVVAATSLAVATAATLGITLALGIVPAEPRAAIPLGSMILSNAMNTTSLVMTRLYDDLAGARREVEARLSLGQPAAVAAGPWRRSSLRTGMLPIIDNTKVVGLVALPGAMTGMLLAGASATAAIRLQLVVMYMILGGNAFAALVAGDLTLRRLFTRDHQLIRSLRRASAPRS